MLDPYTILFACDLGVGIIASYAIIRAWRAIGAAQHWRDAWLSSERLASQWKNRAEEAEDLLAMERMKRSDITARGNRTKRLKREAERQAA